MTEEIWFFESSGLGVVVSKLDYFKVIGDKVLFNFVSGGSIVLTDKEDVDGFRKRILHIDGE